MVILLRERLLPNWCGPTGAAYTLSVIAHYAVLGDPWGVVGDYGMGLLANHGLIAGLGILALSAHATVTGRLSRAKARRVITGDQLAYEAVWAALLDRDTAAAAEARVAGAGGRVVGAGGGGSWCGNGGGAAEHAECTAKSCIRRGDLALLAETVAELSRGISCSGPLLQHTPPWPPQPLQQRTHGSETGSAILPPDAMAAGAGNGTVAGGGVVTLEQLFAQSAGLDIFLRSKARCRAQTPTTPLS